MRVSLMPPLPMNTSAPATEMAIRLKWASPARTISSKTIDQRDQFDGGFMSLRASRYELLEGGAGHLIEVWRPVDDLPFDANLCVHQVVLQPRHVHRHPQSRRVRDVNEAVLVAFDVVVRARRLGPACRHGATWGTRT